MKANKTRIVSVTFIYSSKTSPLRYILRVPTSHWLKNKSKVYMDKQSEPNDYLKKYNLTNSNVVNITTVELDKIYLLRYLKNRTTFHGYTENIQKKSRTLPSVLRKKNKGKVRRKKEKVTIQVIPYRDKKVCMYEPETGTVRRIWKSERFEHDSPYRTWKFCSKARWKKYLADSRKEFTKGSGGNDDAADYNRLVRLQEAAKKENFVRLKTAKTCTRNRLRRKRTVKDPIKRRRINNSNRKNILLWEVIQNTES